MFKIKKIELLNFFPFLEETKNYNFTKFKADVVAGLTVAIVALPQTMAYAIIAGVHPKFGLYAAIFPAIVASLFGASKYLAAGPTNAISMVVSSTMTSAVIAGTVANNLPENEKMAILFLISFLVGAIQLLMGIMKFGNLINFVSHSVVIGFTTGAGILIAFNQLKNFLGINIGNHSHFLETVKYTFLNLEKTNLFALGIGIFTVSFMIFAKKIFAKIPSALISMIIAAVLVALFNLEESGVKLIGDIPQTLPPISSFSLDIDKINSVFASAMAIAILGIVEALSIAKSIANKSGEKINGNQEFIAQGLSNIVASFTSGIPGSGSFTRSAVNFNSGAKSRFAIVFSGLFILFVLIILAPMARFIPIASLAGILMVIAYNMIDKQAFLISCRATTSDMTVTLTTMIATLFLELEQAVFIGVILSLALFLRKVSHPQVFQVFPDKNNRKLIPLEQTKEYCSQISIFQVDGSLFFGAASELENKISMYMKNGGKIFIVRMANVRILDATGIHAWDSLLKEAQEKNVTMMFVNVRPTVMEVLKKTGVLKKIGKENIFEHTEGAIKSAVKKVEQLGKCDRCQMRCFEECKNVVLTQIQK